MYRQLAIVIYFSLTAVSCKTGPVQDTPLPAPETTTTPAGTQVRGAQEPPSGGQELPSAAPRADTPADAAVAAAEPVPGTTGQPPPEAPATASEETVRTAPPTAPAVETAPAPAPPPATRRPAEQASANPGPERRTLPPPRPTLRVTDRDPIHDETNPAYGLLQRPSTALRGMPLDRVGRVNWVMALEQGLVSPRARKDGPGDMKVLDTDIIMKDTRSMPYVRFPHRAHTEWLSCDSCHPEPFVAADNGNPINMDAIFQGRYCGMCHDKVAFSTFVCERCHNIPHPGSPAKWW